MAVFRERQPEPQPWFEPQSSLSERSEAPATADAGRAAAKRSAPAPAEKLGTGHGRSETSYARHVAFERATLQPVETIAIRYDSYRNLVAMGVIRETPRHPRPFPGFVPDA